jgi:ATP-dependent Clp protease ATP-binding subunit ClpB
MLTDTVGGSQIAGVVSRWTGIPVSKLSQGEKDRLLGLENRYEFAERKHKDRFFM